MIDFAELRSTVQAGLGNILARIVYGGTTGSDDTDAQVIPAPDADAGEDGAEVWQQWGFASRPPPASGVVEVLVVPLEGGLVVLSTRQQRTQVQIAEGDAVLYNAATGCTVKLTAAGRVEITAASGQDVVLNGGESPVAHEGSATTGHTHPYVLAAGPYAVTGTITTQTDTIATGAGSPHVKVPA